MKTPKTLKEIKNHPGVSHISDERDNGDGWWVYLTKDYRDFAFDPFIPHGTIHEQTIKELCQRFRGVERVKK